MFFYVEIPVGPRPGPGLAGQAGGEPGRPRLGPLGAHGQWIPLATSGYVEEVLTDHGIGGADGVGAARQANKANILLCEICLNTEKC